MAGCPPAADGRPVAECPARSRRPSTMIGRVCGSAPDARRCTYDSAPRARRRCGCDMTRNEHAVLSRSCGRLHWQDLAAVRFRGSSRGEIMPRCVPGRRSVAAFSLHAFPKGLRTGKTPVRGKISPPCIRNGLALARYLRHASEKRRKQPSENTPREDLAMKGPLSLRGPLKSCTARGSCRRSALAGRRALCVEGRGAGLRKRTPYCCRRSRVPARHLVAFCGGTYPAANVPPRGTLRPQSRFPALAPPCSRCPALFRSAAASHDPAHKKRPAFCWPFLRGYELSADYSARSFRRRSSSSASWWRLTLPDSVIGMASMNSMCSGRRRLATPMESRYSAMESSVGSTSPV